MIDQFVLPQLNCHHVTSPALLTNPHLRFQRVHFPSGDGIPEEDPRIGFRHHGLRASCAQRHGGVLAGRSTPEVVATDDNGVFGLGLAWLHEACGVRRREPHESVGPELLVLSRIRGHQRQVLRRDDLVGVNVVAHHVAEPVEVLLRRRRR